MPPPPTQDAPNAWSVVGDYAKAVITLAAALLTITVTFSQEVTGKASELSQVWPLIALWGCLLLTIGFGVAALALVVNILRHGTSVSACIFCSNVAFLCLIVSGLLLGVIGFQRVSVKPPWTAAQTVQEALTRLPDLTGEKGSDWKLLTVCWSPKALRYTLVVRNTQTLEKWTVVVDPAAGKIEKAGRHHQVIKRGAPC